MKRLSKTSAIVLSGFAALTLFVFGLAPVFADSPGQLTGGPQVYEVKNITQSGAYADSVNTACGDVIQYSTMLHNSGYGGLTNIVLKADLSGGTITATPAEGATYGTSDSVSVSLPSGGSLSYQSGTTILYDQNGNVVKTLSDGITSGGVNIGNMAGSTLEYVNFRAKVNCPSTPPTPVTYTATATASATANASATASCPGGSGSATASSSATASATATATSDISQADANQKAQTSAQQQAATSAQADAKAKAEAQAKAEVKCSAPVVKTVAKKTSAPKASVLPNTGPGDIAEMFAGSSILGTVGHYFVSRRRK